MEEQMIVSSLLLGVTYPVSWRYTVHLICNVESESVKSALKDRLLERLPPRQNRRLVRFVDTVCAPDYSGPAVLRDKFDEDQIRTRLTNALGERKHDLPATARAQTEKLYFWNAIQTYEESHRLFPDYPFYVERSELHSVLDEWHRALVLAQKSGSIEHICVFSFAFGNLLPAFKNREFLLQSIQQNTEGIIGKYELSLVVLLSLLGEMSISEVHSDLLSHLIVHLERLHLGNGANALRAFASCRFAEVLSFVRDFGPLELLSLYLCFACDPINRNVRVNCIAQFVASLANVSLDSIAQALGINDEATIELLSEAVERQKVIGRIDLIARTFHRVPGLAEWQAKKKVIDDTAVLALRVESQRRPDACCRGFLQWHGCRHSLLDSHSLDHAPASLAEGSCHAADATVHPWFLKGLSPAATDFV
jgi:hypothetical protein